MKRFIALIATVAFLSTASLYGAKEVKLDGVTCPVSGKAVKAEHAVAYKGAKAYFCCPNCPKAFAGDTAKFAAKANHQLVLTGQFKLAQCPLKQKPLNTATNQVLRTWDTCGRSMWMRPRNWPRRPEGSTSKDPVTPSWRVTKVLLTRRWSICPA